MAASVANMPADPVQVDEAKGSQTAALPSKNPYGTPRAPDDPFMSTPTSSGQPPQRFSQFDPQLFSLDAAASPAQAKRALEAHLAETERRIHDASKLGTTLVQQRRDLSKQLREVEEQQKSGEIKPELRQKLLDIEREYHEVGRESARASLGPKNMASGPGDSTASPYPADGRQRPASPSKFSTQAVDSPSKINVPSRKARNQPANGVHDSEFYAEISTSLLTQVRNLQAIIAERDENLKTVNLEKSRLEVEAEGFAQRLRSLDESEQRYKDENWNLETQTHELIAGAKQAADRERKLLQSLSTASAEKAAAEKELDELRQTSGKLGEDHSASKKHHEAELSILRRDLTVKESEGTALRRRIEELDSQNKELAAAVAGRFRHEETEAAGELDDATMDALAENTDPEASPPPSPSKGTPRHSMLESETLKSSLHHAHRMIQNLKGNIHREKTEKTELKRMLQEARDELEIRRGDGGAGGAANSAAKRKKNASDKDLFKKPAKPALLGAGRNSKDEIVLDEAWEDHTGENSPSRPRPTAAAGTPANRPLSRTGEQSTQEGSDAFETANEREGSTTNDEAFQTGAESLAGDSSDELTETEGGVARGGTLRAKPAPITTNPPMRRTGNRDSFHSTASTSTDEEEEQRTPSLPQQQQRYRLRINRGGAANRRSRTGDASSFKDSPTVAKDSPASFMSSSSQLAPPGQSLFSELGDLDGDDSEEEVDGTPSRESVLSRGSEKGSRPGTARKPPANWASAPPLPTETKDTGMMTEPWEPTPAPSSTPAGTIGAALAGTAVGAGAVAAIGDRQSPATQGTTPTSTVTGGPSHVPSGQQSTMSAINASHTEPVEPAARRAAPLRVAGIQSQDFEPVRSAPEDGGPTHPPPPAPFALSAIRAQETEPVVPAVSMPALEKPIVSSAARTDDDDNTGPPKTDDDQAARKDGGFFGSVFSWRKSQHGAPQPRIAEDRGDRERSREPDQTPATSDNATLPFRDISHNVGDRVAVTENKALASAMVQARAEMADHGAQTLLSADQIDQLMKERARRPTTGGSVPGSPSKSLSGQTTGHPLRSHRSQESVGSTGRPRARSSEQTFTREELAALRAYKRPGSSASMRSSTGMHPPLPPDHKEAIAAAAQRASLDQGSVMGPPLAPASAYRTSNQQHRPRTPSAHYQQSPSTRGGTTPRARFSSVRSDVTSPTGTRRSSVSSFASELDDRFNIRTDGMAAMPQGLEGAGANPRMIQAITQTMIGEYLWKYTRKAGRSQTSDKRHQRFFWVHPYTCTLYWSDRNPATAGRAEVKAKSVAIERVHVVSDSNEKPPALHSKSIVVKTPGRSVKFTAVTEQGHNTWFNALSYLLQRTGAGEGMRANEGERHGGQGLTAEDVDEFNPGRVGRARSRGAASLSSYNSRTTRQTSRSRAAPGATDSISSRMSQREQPGSMSRFSTILRSGTALRGSFSSRKTREESIYDASEVHDSAEDLREAVARQDREADRLENVRACCDGKHDVGSLAKRGRHASHTSRHSQNMLGNAHDNHAQQHLHEHAEEPEAGSTGVHA
ncbi:MAG: hypothetical protein M1832_000691 [Thelocarpon impressellum]|nr:MAG: hypothetical protein M1832_000691 [Thelocarpon impressellum]